MPAAYEISHDWEDPEELHALLEAVRDLRPDANVRRIRYAYYIAERAHKGQTRKSGEPYITHPLAVAKIVVDLRGDDDSICAALLHDVLEDSDDYSPEHLGKLFGDDVLHLVQGVTKLKFAHQGELTARQRRAAEANRTAETLRKLLLAMAADLRVMVIKLADRLHNMQTLGAMPPEKQSRIANETLDIYAPLAARLGIWQVKWQLEDLSFKALHPAEYRRVEELVAKSRAQREEELQTARRVIKRRFEEAGIAVQDIRGRPKHLYSIHNKMVKQGVPFEEIYDLLAMRIIVDTIPECYMALGIVHEAYGPIPSLFYDYIARPKPNGYQSLHTKVLGPNNQPLEIQIRTRQMHEVAEHGVAAHWTYKEGVNAMDETKRLSRLREQLFDWSSDSRTSSDFFRSVSTDLFAEQVFVFTPKGDVIDLPAESTPVDFAFRVHTQLGMTLVGAKINGAIVPLNTRLRNGDVIDLITRSNAQPSMDWLEFTKSAHARSRIRAHFRKLSRNDDAHRGRELIDKEFKALGLDPKQYLGDEKLNKLSETYDSIENGTDLLAKVGSGLLSVQNVVSKLRGTVQESTGPAIHVTKTREGKIGLTAAGMDNMVMARAKCCNPIPGDEVVGYVTRGRGIMIHRKVCPNALAYATSEPERLHPYSWPPDGNVYAVHLHIVSMNRTGLVADISGILSEAKTNISGLNVKTPPTQVAEIDVTIDVRDVEHLSYVMTRISNLQDIISNLRTFGRGKG